MAATIGMKARGRSPEERRAAGEAAGHDAALATVPAQDGLPADGQDAAVWTGQGASPAGGDWHGPLM